jgi:hypothetical protein
MILHAALPFAPWTDPRTRRLPGVQPLDMADWLRVDAVYAAQMALRDRLIAETPGTVHAVLPEARAAAAELLTLVLPRLPGLGFRPAEGAMVRPDGVTVAIDRAEPLLTLGRLLQEDFCLMQEDGRGEHRLTGAILCFPAGWTLAEKLGQPLMRIHAPIPVYDAEMGRRVQRLMDSVRPEAPLWRMNANASGAPLYNPQPEDQPRGGSRAGLPYVRCERQCLVRLAESRAVVFSIHSYVVRKDDLTEDQAAALALHPLSHTADPQA